MDEFIKVAQQAAEEAGEYLKEKINKVSSIEEKRGAFDIVTDADIKVQKLIIKIIKKHFPHHAILAEEDKTPSRWPSGLLEGGIIGKIADDCYTWAIDPVDGTASFACKLPTYSSSIALLKDQKPIVGAVYLAITDEVVWAVKGRGAFSGKKQLRVKNTSKLNQAAVGFDPAYEREKVIKTIAAPLSDRVRILPMIWSQAAALSLVAKGILDGYIQCNNPHVWDVAAGKLFVEEAGGVITDFSGRPLDIFNINGYVAGSKSIASRLVNFVKSAY